jgi:hypothetical protein
MPKPYHPPLLLGARTYDFSHLNPFLMDVVSRIAGKDLRIHVRFMTHCFTKKYDASTHPSDELVLRDAGGRPRTFCPVRYGLSFRIPNIIRELNNPKASVKQTAQQRNWLHSITVDQPMGKYHIFFELRRTPIDVRDLQDLNLVVESAYLRDPGRAEPAVRGSMGFVLLCGKVYKGEPTATRR